MTITDPNSHASAVPAGSDPGEAMRSYGASTGNGTEALYGSVGEAPPAPVEPVPPLRLRTVSGRYRSPASGFQLEMRVDVDRHRPLNMLSGDYCLVAGGTTTYFGSWTVDGVTIVRTPTTIRIVGTARTTWTTTYTVATVTIPRRFLFQDPAPAVIEWSTPSGAKGAAYGCAFISSAFRLVELEQDHEVGVTPFASYDTGSLPSGGPARTLTVAAGYAEAGVQMLDTNAGNAIATPADTVWTNASLHDAMEKHFSRWADQPQFKVWLLHANAHEFGPGLLGIMFDQQGPQRQGCASFYRNISSGSAADLRDQLYVNVHELGHCFNLFHSFHKTFMTPPLPNRPGALSWMNYPRNYDPGDGSPTGEAAFWGAFPFEFDALELAHVRHGFRNSVIMGGNPFGAGAAVEIGEAFSDPLVDRSGLALRVGPTSGRPVLGTPVVIAIELTVERPQPVHQPDQLHPKYGFVQIAVSRPRGDVVVHRPPVQHCAVPALVPGRRGETFPISAYIGYDAGVGHIFEDVGTYRIRASYTAPDGTAVLSNVTTVRLAAPRTEQQDRVADLMLEAQTGMVLTLLGSDSRYLAAGMENLETVRSDHGDHPAAVFADLALGVNAARPFVDVRNDGSVRVRERDLPTADALLDSAVEASRGDGGLDDLTVLQVITYLADSHRAEGDTETAATLRDDASRFAEAKALPSSVVEAFGAAPTGPSDGAGG